MKTRRARGIFVFSVALLARLAIALWARDRVPPTADGAFYHVVAGRIAEGDGYTWAWPDGAVTYAAHYPVGYPALLGLAYFLFGAAPFVAMLVNSVLGAAAAPLSLAVAERLVPQSWSDPSRRKVGLVAGLGAALNPSLVFYAAALMTEALVGVLLLAALYVALIGREKTGRSGLVAFVVGALLLGLATLTRPQCVVLAPVYGFVALSSVSVTRRVVAAFGFTLATLAVTTPWTLRNCARMERCVFVSANGGWNLLIGTYPEGRGAWVPIDESRVPVECREVFQEAKKDECFGAAGRRRALADKRAFLGLVPAKWTVTFDHTGSAADHLSAAGALDDRGKWWLAAFEIVVHRLLGACALIGVIALLRPGGASLHLGFRLLAFVAFAVSAYGSFAALGLASLVVAVLRRQPTLLILGAALASVFAVHAVFFGAGRYFLPMVPLLVPVAAFGVFIRGFGRSGDPSESSGSPARGQSSKF